MSGGEGRGKIAPVPKYICYPAFFITFTVPNLVFSGRSWFDTLHIMKWSVTMIPIAILTIIAGFNLFRRGAGRAGFKMDRFQAAWLLLIILITSQPFFISMSSFPTFLREWFFFATLFAVYMLSYNLKPRGAFFRSLLWGSSVNASLNVLFAEIVVRGIRPEIAIGETIMRLPFIMNVPGNYVGNTGQQEMLGLWVAMAVLNCLHLHLYYAERLKSGKSHIFLMVLNFFFMAANVCGLWRTTSRGAIFALFAGLAVMFICFARDRASKAILRLVRLIGVVLGLFALVLVINPSDGTNRGSELAGKLADMVRNPGSFGGRISIWRVSNEIFRMRPIAGVGLGHYKWRFLEGQGAFFEKYPELLGDPNYSWQYTYWAHSEYLQWLCETGIIGAALLGLMMLRWLVTFIRRLASGAEIHPDALWGASMLCLLLSNALFSRPFHRIEIAVWAPLAFASANGFILPERESAPRRAGEFAYRCFGAFVASVAICGLIFLGGGVVGDKLLYLGGGVVDFDLRYRSFHPIADELKREYINRAEYFLMSMEDASEQMAFLDLEAAGLAEAFNARPNSERLFRLYDYAWASGSADMLTYLLPYMPPDAVIVE